MGRVIERMIPRLIGDVRKAAALRPRGWFDLLRAVAELAMARRELARSDARDLIAEAVANHLAAPSPAALRLVERVGFAIERMGPRVPWRGDCLVQALAARRWLSASGCPSTLHIGVRNEGGFAAHAWLTVGDQVVTGGPVDDYAPVLGEAQPRSAAALSTNQR